MKTAYYIVLGIGIACWLLLAPVWSFYWLLLARCVQDVKGRGKGLGLKCYLAWRGTGVVVGVWGRGPGPWVPGPYLHARNITFYEK